MLGSTLLSFDGIIVFVVLSLGIVLASRSPVVQYPDVPNRPSGQRAAAITRMGSPSIMLGKPIHYLT